MLFRKIALVGVGLLGGSLALAIRERKLAAELQGYVRRQAALAECEQVGLQDFATRDLLVAVRNADLVILCTPIAQMPELVQQMLPALKSGAIVSDVGSVKASVIAQLEPMVLNAGACFVGAHPMAGAEKTGVLAARADLFHDAVCVLTPTPASSAALPRMKELWSALGARVLQLRSDVHDELVACCSHLPHVVAAALANLVLDPARPKEQPLLCANGFRDTTRIASGSPEMWRDIAVANCDELAKALRAFIESLQHIQQEVETGDARALETFFSTARQRRDAWCAQAASPSPE